jgi:ferredoxin-thioredoxin reductase catalytic subunit
MKKFWRCHVCNDIHFGIKPPELCPTCLVEKAYVEISQEEAKQLCGFDGTIEAAFDFRKAIENFAEGNEFQINTDEQRVETLLKGIINNQKNHGMKYCPCRMITKEFKEDVKLICPCNFRIHETYKDKDDGECWCGLFIRRQSNE